MVLRASRLLVLVVAAALAAALSACATTPTSAAFSAAAHSTPAADQGPAAELRLGYFANVTHAGPVYGVGTGLYQRELGSTRLKTQIFTAGGAAIEALFAGSIDAAYVGPTPAVNGFARSQGSALRIVAGATSGGAAFVVDPSITNPQQLRGRIVADPQTGATQDVALRSWLAGHGLREDKAGGGDVTIRAQDNATTLDEFKSHRIAGAWVPEPWASRLVLEGGGRVLVDEASQWPGGKFVTTNLVVRTTYLQQHPQTVTRLLQAQVAADRQLAAHPAQARAVVNAQLTTLTGKALAPATIARAFSHISVTEDPLARTLQTSAQHAQAAGLLPPVDLHGIYDLTLLRKVLGTDVSDAGLGATS